MSLSSIPLTAGWSFAQLPKDGSPPASFDDVEKIPTSVHVELLKLGKIADPFKGMDEWACQWVGEADWVFKTTFAVAKDELKKDSHELVFEGLDTFCTVFLNNKEILKTTSMFHAHRVPVAREALKADGNELRLEFESAFLRGKKEERENGGKLGLWNGDSSRLYVRKAQYHYGWDWGPVLMECGPWRPIYLESFSSRIADVRVDSVVSEDLSTVKVAVTVETEGAKARAIAVALKTPSGEVIMSGQCESGKLSWELKKGQVDFWYPIHYGAQPIYHVEVSLIGTTSSSPVDTVVKKVGFRRARVVQEPLEGQEGKTFLFEVNDVRIFCGGSNWIPADSFLSNVTDARYRDWLQLMVDGNQNMIRVWAGGIYEPDYFYDTCDELGILVWQDFMFGCGQYPAHDAMIESVKLEAEQAVKRLRDHPSLVIFAGNNEDYQVAESLKLDLDYADETSDFRKTNFPARHIYERTLPEVVERLSDIYYHRGSPYSGEGKETTDRTLGDLHQWNVWHGEQKPWTEWGNLSGRFVSEFGMEAMPDMRTIEFWLDGDKSQAYPQSRVMANHNKADGYERRLALYMIENYKSTSFKLEDYVYISQIMQAECIAAAYRLWRREWRGRGKEYTAGALVWQLNDCWPVTSWAITDYFGIPKPAFFAIKRELATFTVGLARKETTTPADEDTAAHVEFAQEMEIWGTNSTLEPRKAVLEVKTFDVAGKILSETKTDVTLAPNASTELHKGPVPGMPVRKSLAEDAPTVVINCRLLESDGTVIARYADWPMPYKYVVFPDAYDPLKITVDGDQVTLEANAPVKGVVLDVEGDTAKWSDQCLDLVPGDKQVVTATGLNGRPVTVRYYGKDDE